MKTIPMTPKLYDYVIGHCPLPHPILEKVALETQSHPQAGMQISRDQGAFMNFLAASVGARQTLEIGCFTGYSAIAVAAALPTDGKLFTLDISEPILAQAAGYFAEAGLASRIVPMLGPALTSLEALLDRPGPGKFDMAFIDADKANMTRYYELCLKLLRPGGVVIADNVLWHGRVIDPQNNDIDTIAIRDFNERVSRDERVDRMLLHISDGLFLARKR